MTQKKAPKKRLVIGFNNLSPELQDQVKAKYPLGFSESMMRIDKPNGDFFYAVSFSTDEIDYLVKIDVKIDGKAADDDDKDFFDDEIKGDDELGGEDGDDTRSQRDSYDDDEM